MLDQAIEILRIQMGLFLATHFEEDIEGKKNDPTYSSAGKSCSLPIDEFGKNLEASGDNL